MSDPMREADAAFEKWHEEQRKGPITIPDCNPYEYARSAFSAAWNHRDDGWREITGNARAEIERAIHTYRHSDYLNLSNVTKALEDILTAVEPLPAQPGAA